MKKEGGSTKIQENGERESGEASRAGKNMSPRDRNRDVKGEGEREGTNSV